MEYVKEHLLPLVAVAVTPPVIWGLVKFAVWFGQAVAKRTETPVDNIVFDAASEALERRDQSQKQEKKK